jgi:hypothetical protein
MLGKSLNRRIYGLHINFSQEIMKLLKISGGRMNHVLGREVKSKVKRHA